MWVFSIGSKLIPCILLIYLSLTLIQVLMAAKTRKQRLKQRNFFGVKKKIPLDSESMIIRESGTQQFVRFSTNHSCFNHEQALEIGNRKYGKGSDRTTRMLLAVLLIFLITEFPNGIIFLLSGILGEIFYQNVCLKVGEILDILALINSSANFILYCTMSRMFRTTFTRMYCLKINYNNIEVTKFSVPKTFYNISSHIDNHNITCV